MMRISSVLVVLCFAAILAAQDDPIAKKRLQTPATVTGVIGGESHDSYVIHADAGRTMSVQLSWQRTPETQAQVTVTEGANFFDASPVTFGRESDKGRRWSGKVPKTADYYLYVVGHPVASYTLRVTVK